MNNLITLKNNTHEIIEKRMTIANRLAALSSTINRTSLKEISVKDLEHLFNLYDSIFFQSWFQKSFQGKIKLSCSRKMTRSAGLTLCPKNIKQLKPRELVLEIRIGTDFFMNYNLIEGDKTVCGLKAGSSLEALQLVFEHELCHVIEFILFNRSNCKGALFKEIAGNLFGHTQGVHQLPTYLQIAAERYGLKVGDWVSFQHKGMEIKGIVSGINKRAVVMVKDRQGSYRDSKGLRYTKYYVPINVIKPLCS